MDTDNRGVKAWGGGVGRLVGVNGGEKGDIWNAFSNKDLILKIAIW